MTPPIFLEGGVVVVGGVIWGGVGVPFGSPTFLPSEEKMGPSEKCKRNENRREKNREKRRNKRNLGDPFLEVVVVVVVVVVEVNLYAQALSSPPQPPQDPTLLTLLPMDYLPFLPPILLEIVVHNKDQPHTNKQRQRPSS